MLTNAQLDSFHRDGFLVMPGVVRGRELALLQTVSAGVVADGCAGRGEHHLRIAGPDGREVYWRSERMWSRHDIFRAAAANPELLENVGQCIGETFFPWNDSLVVKIPEVGGAVRWHQDPPYGNPERTAVFATPNFTCDIYLDASDEDNGCVHAVPGHHLVGHVAMADDAAMFAHPAAVPVRMAPGDVLFHALSTPHGSRPNRSPRQRRTFYIHYLTEAVHRDCGYVHKEGWTPARQELVADMVAARARLGFAGPANPAAAWLPLSSGEMRWNSPSSSHLVTFSRAIQYSPGLSSHIV